jgi:hypothetical protein
MVMIIGICALPESPRLLVKQGKDAEALAVLAALDDLPYTDPKIQQLYHAIRETVEIEDGGGKKSSLRDLFTGGRSQNFRRAMLGIVIQCFQQITGKLGFLSSCPEFNLKPRYKFNYLLCGMSYFLVYSYRMISDSVKDPSV